MSGLRRVGLIALFLLLGTLVTGTVALGQTGKRLVRGQVLDAEGEAVAQAIVHLKNKASGETATMVTSAEGRYQFNDVDMKSDYKIHAELKGAKSRQRSISQFDTRPIVVINLTLEAPEDAGKQAEEKKEEKN